MATLASVFSAQTSNSTSSGYAMSGTTAIVEVQNDSTMGEAYVVIQACSADTSAKYSTLDGDLGVMRGPGVRRIDLLAGMYLRLVLAGVKSGVSTSVNATLTY